MYTLTIPVSSNKTKQFGPFSSRKAAQDYGLYVWANSKFTISELLPPDREATLTMVCTSCNQKVLPTCARCGSTLILTV